MMATNLTLLYSWPLQFGLLDTMLDLTWFARITFAVGEV